MRAQQAAWYVLCNTRTCNVTYAATLHTLPRVYTHGYAHTFPTPRTFTALRFTFRLHTTRVPTPHVYHGFAFTVRYVHVVGFTGYVTFTHVYVAVAHDLRYAPFTFTLLRCYDCVTFGSFGVLRFTFARLPLRSASLLPFVYLVSHLPRFWFLHLVLYVFLFIVVVGCLVLFQRSYRCPTFSFVSSVGCALHWLRTFAHGYGLPLRAVVGLPRWVLPFAVLRFTYTRSWVYVYTTVGFTHYGSRFTHARLRTVGLRGLRLLRSHRVTRFASRYVPFTLPRVACHVTGCPQLVALTWFARLLHVLVGLHTRCAHCALPTFTCVQFGYVLQFAACSWFAFTFGLPAALPRSRGYGTCPGWLDYAVAPPAVAAVRYAHTHTVHHVRARCHLLDSVLDYAWFVTAWLRYAVTRFSLDLRSPRLRLRVTAVTAFPFAAVYVVVYVTLRYAFVYARLRFTLVLRWLRWLRSFVYVLRLHAFTFRCVVAVYTLTRCSLLLVYHTLLRCCLPRYVPFTF